MVRYPLFRSSASDPGCSEIRDALHVLIESLALPSTSKHGAFLHHAISSKLHDERAANDWLDTYLACGELDLGECDRDTWIRDEIKKYSSAQWLEEEEVAVLEKSLRSLVEVSWCRWRLLTTIDP